MTMSKELQSTGQVGKDVLLQLVKNDFPETENLSIPDQACDYLTHRMMGADHPTALRMSGAMPIAIMLWQQNSEFSSIMSQIKQAEAMMLESVVWDQALSNPKASIERMFALKSRMSEYKDNAPPTGQSITNVRISIDGQDYDVSASFRDKGEFKNE